jgi:TolB protein
VNTPRNANAWASASSLFFQVRFLTAALALVVALIVGASSRALPGNGARIAFTRAAGENLNSEIWTADGSGGDRRRLIRIPRAAADEPAWSPAGQWIAFSVDHDPPAGTQLEIYRARLDGSGIRRLTGGARKRVDVGPAWSPDGRWIAFSRYTHDAYRGLGVFLMRSNGYHQHRLTSIRCDSDPAWSPDGRKVVLARCGSLFIVNANGSHARRLTRPPPGDVQDEQPDWSPDGRLIAFVRAVADRTGEIDTIHVIRPEGTGERQLTDSGDDRSPSWSPDGRLLAYSSLTQIRTVSPSTGRRRTLVAVRGSDLTGPAWRR